MSLAYSYHDGDQTFTILVFSTPITVHSLSPRSNLISVL